MRAAEARRVTPPERCDACGAEGFRLTVSPDGEAQVCDGCLAALTGRVATPCPTCGKPTVRRGDWLYCATASCPVAGRSTTPCSCGSGYPADSCPTSAEHRISWRGTTQQELAEALRQLPAEAYSEAARDAADALLAKRDDHGFLGTPQDAAVGRTTSGSTGGQMSGQRQDPQNFLADLDEPQYALVERPGKGLTERPWKPVPLLPWPVYLLLLVASVVLTFGGAATLRWLS